MGAAHVSSLAVRRAAQLHLAAAGGGGAFDGRSHAGVELSLRNTGADRILPAPPVVTFGDPHGRVLAAARRALPGR